MKLLPMMIARLTERSLSKLSDAESYFARGESGVVVSELSDGRLIIAWGDDEVLRVMEPEDVEPYEKGVVHAAA